MQKIKQLEKEIEKEIIENGGWGDTVKQEIQLETLKDVLKKIDEEKQIVKKICQGLAHPSQDNQKEFTKWLQDTVNFHLNQLKQKIEGI